VNAGPHFVVGMPRAGTTYLVHRLNEHPDIVAFGESRFFAEDWVEPGADGCYGPQQLATVRHRLRANPLDTNVGEHGPEPDRRGWMHHLGRPQLADLVDAVFDRLEAPLGPADVFAAYTGAIARAEGKEVAVEKTPRHVRHVDRILGLFPAARFVVMVRGPEEFLLSYKHMGDTRRSEQRSRAERRWHPVGVALLWRSYLRHALTAVARHPAATLLVRNEDLRDEPARVLGDVQRFLGVEQRDLAGRDPAGVGRAEATNSSFAGARPRLEPAELAWCRWLAGRDAAAAGYPIGEERAPAASLVRTGVGVVPWAVRNAVDARRRMDGSVVAYARDAVWRRRGT
jgi:Sulfotransferase family